ncbi:phosphopantetheine-binding protein [Bradyrhizobium sp. STM 3566]|uniref:phosphopantetheine-binding protein n=1 Tax=Bradyrhizobium sp. STM 3566 TaxID=578928 RepID=UPI00388EA3ED
MSSACHTLYGINQAAPTSLAFFRLVDSVPLTTSGKIDRTRLSSVPYRGIETSQSAEPRTRNERVLARIWEDLLGVKGVGIDSSFFDIGGESLLSVRCVTLACKAGLNLTVNQLYRTPTIRELAAGETEAAPHNVVSANNTCSGLTVTRLLFRSRPSVLRKGAITICWC